VTNGVRADPRGCAYGSVCGHMTHGACGLGWDTRHGIWRRHWTCGRALRGDVPGYRSVCGDMAHGACGPRWDTRHGICRQHWTFGRRIGPTRTSGPLGGGGM
jgi:hypothetical protein